jgi:ComF family protein
MRFERIAIRKNTARNTCFPLFRFPAAYSSVSPDAASAVILKSAIDSLASVLFPAPCAICGQTLTTASRIPVCEPCLHELERIAHPMCVCCGRPLVASPSSQAVADGSLSASGVELRCRLCRANFYAFDGARSFAVYNRALSEAILLLKYEQVTSLAGWFGARLAEIALEAEWHVDVVVPVPLHRDRRRERGYNQAELIARTVARRLKLRLDAKFLVRIKPRPPQLVLSRAEHWRSVRGAYATQQGMKIDNLRVLLLDDVLTTGATLDACSRVLKKAGASAVFGLTVGRVRSGAAAAVALPAVPTNPATKLD